MHKVTHYLSLILLIVAAYIVIALQIKALGWVMLLVGAGITLTLCAKTFRKEIILLYIAIGCLSFATISTAVTLPNLFSMGIPLAFAVIIPYVIGKYFYKNPIVQFNFTHERKWQKKEIGYILFTALVVYLLLPFFLRVSGSYHNWTVKPDLFYLFAFFLGINAVGAYDEVFFMSTVQKILRRHFPFLVANIGQSCVFTIFLYELGFRGWITPGIFLFAFIQGKIFQKTNSLFYLIAIHLTADFILYLALIHAYYPPLMPIFLIQ